MLLFAFHFLVYAIFFFLIFLNLILNKLYLVALWLILISLFFSSSKVFRKQLYKAKAPGICVSYRFMSPPNCHPPVRHQKSDRNKLRIKLHYWNKLKSKFSINIIFVSITTQLDIVCASMFFLRISLSFVSKDVSVLLYILHDRWSDACFFFLLLLRFLLENEEKKLKHWMRD